MPCATGEELTKAVPANRALSNDELAYVLGQMQDAEAVEALK